MNYSNAIYAKLLMALSAVLMFLQSNAQQFKAGITGSVDLVSMNGFPQEGSSSRESKSTFSYGIYGNCFLKPGIQLNLDILYAELGDRFKDQELRMDFQHHYLQFPLTIRYFFNKNTDGFFIEGGPQFSFLLDQTLKISGNNQSTTIETDEFFRKAQMDARINSEEIACVFGLGLKAGIFAIGAKYMYGLTPAFSGGDLKKVRNSGIRFYAALGF